MEMWLQYRFEMASFKIFYVKFHVNRIYLNSKLEVIKDVKS